MLSFTLTVVASWGIYALLALGIVLVYRTNRILNIASGELAIFVGYVAATAIAAGLPFWGAFLIAIAGAGALGLVIFRFAIKRILSEPPYVGLMLTVGLAPLLNGIIIIAFGGGLAAVPTGLPPTVTIATARFSTADVFAAAGAWISIALILGVYRLTDLGLQMRAVSERVTLSAQRGLNVNRIGAFAWMIGFLAIGLAGFLHGERSFVSLPSSVIGVSALIACLIGGMDSLKGAIIASLIVSFSENFTALYIDPRYVLIAPVTILFVILIVRPWGLFGTVEDLKRV